MEQSDGPRRRVGTAVGVQLASARVHKSCARILLSAEKQELELSSCIDTKVALRVRHAGGVADLSREVENDVGGAHMIAQRVLVRDIAMKNLDRIANGVYVERVRPAAGHRRIHNGDLCALLNQAQNNVTAEEAQASCDYAMQPPIFHHRGAVALRGIALL
jgi:hypothetical protein